MILNGRGIRVNRTIKLTDELSIHIYAFSDYITCVEVMINGQLFNVFCSENTCIEELLCERDWIVSYINNNVNQSNDF